MFALEGQDDLVLIVRRVEALGKFLDTDDGKNLLAGNKRATNILRIEEKKDSARLHRRARSASSIARTRNGRSRTPSTPPRRKPRPRSPSEDFAAAMTRHGEAASACRRLLRQGDGQRRRGADKDVRDNRLKLLNEIRDATRAVADFSRIEG